MSTLMQCNESPSISSFSENGFGPDFLQLKKHFEKTIKELRKSETLGRQDEILQSIDEVFKECSYEGWDGYDASPITRASYVETIKFIKSLPLAPLIQTPEITPEPSGEIALEWARGSRQIFVASFTGKNEIIYAGLFGTNKIHGTEYFGDFLPSAIIENIERIYS
ncbi:hypothetical protein MNBD_NITROSPIRAE01-1569 [hydrothermal vent metagenome]|uniref:Uncharacterized protein n=1 Tax=hydrothermal vent metagenome TaxID=652676 RepID=A0A3B1DA03_9ZZZZ